MDTGIRNSTSYRLFPNTLLKFITPAQRKAFIINNSVGIKLLTRLQLGFGHIHEHKFRHGFRDILNPVCPGTFEAETTTHHFFRCHFYNAKRIAPMNNLNEFDSSLSALNDNKLMDLILYHSDIYIYIHTYIHIYI